MGIYCTSAGCGDIHRPPSRTNFSLIAIIELIIMAVVGILCLVDLVRLIQWMGDTNSKWDLIEILRVVEYGLIVAGLAFILVGIFCCPSMYYVRTGIMCFCLGTILAVVIVVLLIINDRINDSLAYNIFYVIFLVILAWLLWIQSGNL